MIGRVTLRMLPHLSGVPHLHASSGLKKILQTFPRYSSFFLLLRSHQVSQQTNSGRVRDQPELPVPEASLI